MGICQPRQKTGVKFMGVKAASQNNAEKGSSDKIKIKYAEFPRDTSIVAMR